MRSLLRAALDALKPAPVPVRVPPLPGARVFPAFGVQVAGGTVYGMDGTPLGPLAGARAAITDAGGYVIHGAITANPLPTRKRATVTPDHQGFALLAFPDGTLHRKRLFSAHFHPAQSEVVVLNTMAGR
jgi:hypothetical protein